MDKETEVWFAMRATYRRELEAMHLLEKANIGCFIPMQYKINPLAELSQCILDSSNGSIINVI